MHTVKDRVGTIGGSDAAGALALSRWTTPLQVALETRGEAPPKNESEAMWFGTNTEALTAKRAEEKYDLGEEVGARVVFGEVDGPWFHPEHRFLRYHPDRILLEQTNPGEWDELPEFAEFKWRAHFMRSKYGEEDTADVLVEDLCQVAFGFACKPEMIRCQFFVVFGGNYMVRFLITREQLQPMIDKLVPRWVEFFHRYCEEPYEDPPLMNTKDVVHAMRDVSGQHPMPETFIPLLRARNAAKWLLDRAKQFLDQAELDLKTAFEERNFDVAVDSIGKPIVSYRADKNGKRTLRVSAIGQALGSDFSAMRETLEATQEESTHA